MSACIHTNIAECDFVGGIVLTLRFMPNTSSVLYLHPTLVPLVFVQSLYSPFLFIYLLQEIGHADCDGNPALAIYRGGKGVVARSIGENMKEYCACC